VSKNEESSRHDATLESLEAELRALPQLEVPAGLQAKLLAAIPARPGGVLRPRRVAWLVGLGALGVAAALLVTMSLWSDVQSPRQQPGLPSAVGSTSPEYILAPAIRTRSEETRPWDVQPPLPY